MIRPRRLLLVPCLLLLAACSQPEPPSNVDSPEPASPTTAARTSAPSTQETASVSATLKDAKGDADSADFTSVRLDRTTDDLRVTYQLADGLPRNGAAGIFLSVSSSDGSAARQAGVKWLDGDQIAYFVYDFEKQKNLPGEVVTKGNKIIATFPLSEFAPLGDLWKWSATTSIEGEDLDDCPDQGSDPLNPKKGTLSSR